MTFDAEGHVVVSPKELDDVLRGDAPFDDLVYSHFLRGTPHAFPTHAQYCAFLRALSETLRIHPQNVCVRGSGWFGFSMSPDPEKLWTRPAPDGDVDVAFVDGTYHGEIEGALRHWESKLSKYPKSVYDIRNTRRFFYYRYFDLPNIEAVKRHNAAFAGLPMEALCGTPRPVNAFIYKDWWSVVERMKYDLTVLRKGMKRGGFPQGGEEPTDRVPSLEVKPPPRKRRPRS